MKKSIAIIFIGTSTVLLGEPLAAQELSYNLPKGTAVAGYSWQIKKCPTINDTDVIIDSGGSVKGSYSKGTLVRLNPRSPFLSSRKVTLTYHDNGMLKTINAEGEGKGGAVLSSILNTAVSVATLTKDKENFAPQPLLTVCKREIEDKLTRLGLVSDRIDKFEGQIASGNALGSAAKALYDSDVKEKAELEKALTITVAAKTYENYSTDDWDADAQAYISIKQMSEPQFDTWFDAREDGIIKGPTAFCARFTVTQANLTASARSRPLPRSVDFAKLQNQFYYYRPVPVLVEIFEAPQKPAPHNGQPAQATGDTTCEKQHIPQKPKISKKDNVSIPQFSGLFTLPIGSGVFESKAVSAEFTKEGNIVSISYSGSGSGAGVAEALGGALSAAQLLRDADLAETKRQIEKITAENELEALLDAAEDAPD